MKKSVSILVVLLIILMSFPVYSFADDTSDILSFTADYINAQIANDKIVIYTTERGTSTQTQGSQLYEVAVDSNGIVIEIGDSDTAIPENGFVICAGASKSYILSAMEIGDKVAYDENSCICVAIDANYSPFVEYVLNYDAINAVRSENKLIIYQNKETTETNIWGYEACVDSNGTIVAVGENNNKIPNGGYVISGVGTRKTELENIVQLGYSAELDESSKTVTLSYSSENAEQGYYLRYLKLENKYKSIRDSFLDIDYETASDSLNKIKSLCDDIKIALSEDDLARFLVKSEVFELEVARFEDAILPYVPVETRNIWLRIPTSPSKAVVRDTVREIYEMGFNSVCIEALFDSTTIMPMPKESYFVQNIAFGGNDMLRMYLDEFHEYGIEVHLWMSCYRVGHEGSSNVKNSVAKKKPEWLVVDQYGSSVVNNEYGDAYFLNPALPEVKLFLLDTYRYILENYDIDGFQLDYVRYPENTKVNFGYDEYTKAKFLEAYNYSSVPVSSNQAGWNDWCKFRASFVTDFVTSVKALIDEIRPDVYFSCDVAPEYTVSLDKMCQDTQSWINNGIVDIIFPMAYGTTDAVEKWTANTVSLTGESLNTVIGLRDNGAKIFREQILAARNSGSDGVAFFSYSQYVSGDYKDYIASTVFAKESVCPTYKAMDALFAQLKYISDSISDRIIPRLENETALDEEIINNIKQFNSELSDSLEHFSDIDEDAASLMLEDIIAKANDISDKMNTSGIELAQNASGFITENLERANKILLQSKDNEKMLYLESVSKPDMSEGSNDSDLSVEPENNQVYEPNAFEKTFQVISLAIMVIGLLGVPAFVFMKSNKKRVEEEKKVRMISIPKIIPKK